MWPPLFAAAGLVLLDIGRKDDPVLSRAGPSVFLQLEPVRIVEGPPGNPTPTGRGFHGPGHQRPTDRTKFRSYPPFTLIRAIFIGLEDAARDFHVSLGEIGRDPKGALGPLLTRGAMAHPRELRRAANPIPHGVTK